MNETAQIIVSALTLLGVGGIVGGYITFLLKQNRQSNFYKIYSTKNKKTGLTLFLISNTT